MLKISAGGWSFGKQSSVPSSPHHSEHAHCRRHRDQPPVAVAQRRMSTLGDLRKTWESPSPRVRPLKHAEAEVCAQALPEAQTSADGRPQSRSNDE